MKYCILFAIECFIHQTKIHVYHHLLFMFLFLFFKDWISFIFPRSPRSLCKEPVWSAFRTPQEISYFHTMGNLIVPWLAGWRWLGVQTGLPRMPVAITIVFGWFSRQGRYTTYYHLPIQMLKKVVLAITFRWFVLDRWFHTFFPLANGCKQSLHWFHHSEEG